MTNIFDGYGIEIEPLDDEGFLKVRETLTRIGIASNTKKELYQSCHILHKRGRYVIIHFKELFALDGKRDTVDLDDIQRRNLITKLLVEWNMIHTIDDSYLDNLPENSSLKVLPYKEKAEWTLLPKYNIGAKK